VIFLLFPLRARKSDSYLYSDSWKSDNFREGGHQKRSKELIPKGIKSDNFKRSNKKNPILL
jgi:hypothetical protein